MKRLMCLILAALSSLYLLAACASSGKPNDSSDVSGVGDESDTNETLARSSACQNKRITAEKHLIF